MILLSHFHIEIQAICSLSVLYFRKPPSCKELQKYGGYFLLDKSDGDDRIGICMSL